MSVQAGLCTILAVEDLRAAFGRRVRELRKRLGLSQEALAERAGLHCTYVSAVERGLRGPSLDVIGRIAGALKVSPGKFFEPLSGRYHARRRRAASN